MEFTPNLKLTQYGPDDVTSWITGYSQDMEKIDTAFGDLANTTSVSNARLEAVEADTAQVKTDVAQMKEDIAVNSASIANAVMDIKTITEREMNHYNALSGEIDTIKQNQASDEDAIKVIQTNSANMRDRIAVNTASISKLKVRVETLEDTVEANQQENVENINRNTANIAQLQQDLTDTDALARKAAIDAASAVNTSSVASAKVVELTLAVEKNANDISDIENKIDGDINTRISTNTNAISELTPRVTKNEQDISNINTEMETVGSRLDALEDGGSTEALAQRVTALETWEGQANTQITTAQQTANTANTVAENVQSQVSGIKSGATVPFSFGVDMLGNYGYKKEGADTVTPFLSQINSRYLTTSVKSNINAIKQIGAGLSFDNNVVKYAVLFQHQDFADLMYYDIVTGMDVDVVLLSKNDTGFYGDIYDLFTRQILIGGRNMKLYITEWGVSGSGFVYIRGNSDDNNRIVCGTIILVTHTNEGPAIVY